MLDYHWKIIVYKELFIAKKRKVKDPCTRVTVAGSDRHS